MLSRSLWCFSCKLRNRIDLYYFCCVTNNKVFWVSRSGTEPIDLPKWKVWDEKIPTRVMQKNKKLKTKILCKKTMKTDLFAQINVKTKNITVATSLHCIIIFGAIPDFHRLVIPTWYYQLPLLPKQWKCDTGYSSSMAAHRVIQM